MDDVYRTMREANDQMWAVCLLGGFVLAVVILIRLVIASDRRKRERYRIQQAYLWTLQNWHQNGRQGPPPPPPP